MTVARLARVSRPKMMVTVRWRLAGRLRGDPAGMLMMPWRAISATHSSVPKAQVRTMTRKMKGELAKSLLGLMNQAWWIISRMPGTSSMVCSSLVST